MTTTSLRPGPVAGSPAPLSSNVTDTALVLEGGGLRASYSSGLLTALLEEQVHLDWVAGISAGSSLAVNYLSRDLWRIKHSFTDFMLDRQVGGIRSYVRGRGLFDAEYIYQRAGLADAALPFAWETFAANPARLRIGAVDAESGEAVNWDRGATASLDALMLRVRASSTMPVLMPPVRLGGRVYFDGALAEHGGIPLSVAQADGFSRFLVVLTQDRSFVKPPSSLDWFFRAYFRRYPAIAEALHARSARYAQTREELFALEESGHAYVFAPTSISVTNTGRSVAGLRASYAAGLAQARAEMPAIKEFLGR